MNLVKLAKDLSSYSRGVLVPTMGALHGGHGALIRCARQHAAGSAPVVVSIFVNPTQFAPGEDFTKYPRTLESDLELCRECGADIVFAPAAEAMYPPDEKIESPPLPAAATQPGLEDAHRPTHFRGVCQVVARLFDLVQPSAVVFGEKDYQQLLVIKAMVQQQRPRWGDLAIVAHPTVRESDGVAMSSRNRLLSAVDRKHATGLFAALMAAQVESRADDARFSMIRMLEAHGLSIDYAEVRDKDTLLPIIPLDGPGRALIAARLGGVRLIDNVPWSPSTPIRTVGEILRHHGHECDEQRLRYA